MALRYGYVAGKILLVRGDGTDSDHMPDILGDTGITPVFRPKVTSFPEAELKALISAKNVTGKVDTDGTLLDEQGSPGIWLVVGDYEVDFGVSHETMSITVTAEHTEANPFWLHMAFDYTPPPRTPVQTVEIPTGGAEGQALVWRDGSFNWEAPPKGDKGDKGDTGEVSLTQLTTALEAKVDGNGLGFRFDTSIGTRILLDHPGGTTMLHGDTGWRNLYHATEGTTTYGTLPEGWAIGSTSRDAAIDIRRITDRILIRIQGIKRVTGGTATLVTLPTGFACRPRITSLPCNTATTASIVQRRVTATASIVVPELAPDDMFGQPQNPYPVIAEFFARDSWPTSQPGQPGTP